MRHVQPEDPRAFEHFAASYDRFVSLEPRDMEWFDRLALTGRRALDAGCGAGHQALALADRFDEVVGVDLSASLIEIARTKRAHPKVRYFVADIHDVRDDAAFDLVYSHTMLHHVPNYSAALRHLRALVRPGGSAVLIDNVCDRCPTPPRRVYLYGAVHDFPHDVRRIGLRDAGWLARFRTSRPWLAHLLSDRYLSRAQFRARYAKVFPDARFIDLGFAMAMIWTAPLCGTHPMTHPAQCMWSIPAV